MVILNENDKNNKMSFILDNADKFINFGLVTSYAQDSIANAKVLAKITEKSQNFSRHL